MTMNFMGCSFPESMASVPSASGETPVSGLCGPCAVSSTLTWSIIWSGLSIHPWTLFEQNTISDPLFIFLGCESPGDESDAQIPWVHPRSPGKSIFPLLLMLISKLAVAVVLAAKNISMTSFLFSVYSFISAFISLYFMLTKMAPIQLIYLTGRVCTRLRGRELEKNNGY